MRSDKSILIRNFISLLSIRGLDFVIPIITIPYLLRTIGIANYGNIGFIYAFALYSGAVVQYGFSVTATRDIARVRNNLQAVERITSEVFVTSLILSVIVMGVSFVPILLITRFQSEIEIYFLIQMQVVLQSIFPIWFFQGMERASLLAYINIFSKLVFMSCLLMFVSDPVDYYLVPVLNILSALLALAGSLWIITRQFNIRLRLTGLGSVWLILKNGRHAFINQLAPNLYNNSSAFILGLYVTPTAFGIYSAAIKVVDAVISVGYVVSNTFLPYLSRNPRNHNKFKAIMFFLGISGTFFLMASSQIIGGILEPNYKNEIGELIRYASPSVFAICIIATYGSNYLMIYNKEKIVSDIAFRTSMFFFVLSIFIIPILGIFGSLSILLGARIVMALILYLSYKRYS